MAPAWGSAEQSDSIVDQRECENGCCLGTPERIGNKPSQISNHDRSSEKIDCDNDPDKSGMSLPRLD
jgi:hypothetical protein